MKATKTVKGTWMDRAGESTDYLKTSSNTGPRVVVHRWTDTNEVEVRAVTGDGRKASGLKEFAKIALHSPTTPELEAAIAQCVRALP